MDRATRSAIVTYSGVAFDPVAPDPALIDIGDVAHALSNVCRYTGHVRTFYSVAQHSVLVARDLERRDLGHWALWGLLHDASEAYIADLAAPIKEYSGLGDEYRKLEAVVMAAVAQRFDLPAEMPDEVKDSDIIVAMAEVRDLMPASPLWEEWYTEGAYPYPIDPWRPATAKRHFLYDYERLKSVDESASD